MFSFFDKYRTKQLLLVFIFISLAPSLLHAHAYGDGSGGFITGFEHPFGGLDHFLAMFSVGLWGA